MVVVEVVLFNQYFYQSELYQNILIVLTLPDTGFVLKGAQLYMLRVFLTQKAHCTWTIRNIRC
jgi:hypothetical protein